MKHKDRRLALAIGMLLLLLLVLTTGCGETGTPSPGAGTAASTTEAPSTAPPETGSVPEQSTETTEPEATEPETTVPETTEPESTEPYLENNEVGKPVLHVSVPADERPAYEYRFNPYAHSSLFTMAYGESVDAEIRGFCDAVLAGEDSFPCTGLENWIRMSEIKDYMLPFCHYVDMYAMGGYFPELLEDGRYPLYYTVPKEEYLSIVEAFQERVAYLIAQADLREGDSDLEKALKLYTATSLRIAYDNSETGPWYSCKAIMGDYGICQEIAPTYAYLLLQAGVDAGVCGTLAKDDSYAHMWTLVKLDGRWYHADVTWQLSEPYSLRYFLLNDAMRDGDGLNMDILNVGEINKLWHKDLPIEDDRYADFWDVRWYAIDHEAGCIEYYDDPMLDYYDLDTYQLERKTLPLE